MSPVTMASIVTGNHLQKAGLWVAVLVLMHSECVSAFFGEWGPDLDGPWCASRPRGQDCCVGRDDRCSVPILGTECYCDIFCNDTAYDCCPDYWKHCHGFRVPTTTPRPTTLPPPRPTRDNLAPCTRDGVYFKPGDIIRDNCNNCTCDLLQVPTRRYEWRCTKNVCLLRPELIQAVNDDPNYYWTAGNHSKLWGLTLDEGIRYRLGTFQLADNVVDMTPIKVDDDVLPESFDARVKWPNILHPISDQGNCASSWAHSSTAVATDRLSIETEGTIKDRLSVQHLLSCDVDGQLGCNGGHLDRAWWFLRQKGVVSEECYPYSSGQTSSKGQCLITDGEDQPCPSAIEYKTEKRYQATPPYRIRPDEREIMKEIVDNGPVQAIIQVREDFFMYNTGVYKYTGLTSLRRDSEEHMKSGFHSVRIIGWGAERTQQRDIIKYWICANSWGTDWGENGYFRIVRGTDESGIESSVIGVWGKVTGDQALRVLLNETRRRRLRVEKARNRRHLRQLAIRKKQQRNKQREHNRGEANADRFNRKTLYTGSGSLQRNTFLENGRSNLHASDKQINQNNKIKKQKENKKHNQQHKHQETVYNRNVDNVSENIIDSGEMTKKAGTDFNNKHIRNNKDKIIYE